MSEVVDFDASTDAAMSDSIRSAFEQPVAVLLGAGASIEAGIPGSFKMTDEIVKAVNENPLYRYNNQGWALNFVCGALQAHATSIGGSFHDSLDVEYVASAVALLAARYLHEAAPFVQQWNPAIEQIEVPQAPPFADNEFKKALSSGAQAIERAIKSGGRQGVNNIKSAMEGGAHGLRTAVTNLIDSRSGHRSTRVYEDLGNTMTKILCQKVEVSNASSVQYLSPLINKARSQGSLVVGTLNYDRSIEVLSADHNLPCITGIESWSNDRNFMTVSDGIQLIKLHGSVDWVDKGGKYIAGRLPSMQVAVQQWSPNMQEKPVIVFGRDKLRASGPFLDLLREWESQIQKVNLLLIAGYSFRDDHINETITRWVNEDEQRQLYVIDPSWYVDTRSYMSFPFILYRQLGDPGGVAAANASPRRLHVIKARTSEALRELFGRPI